MTVLTTLGLPVPRTMGLDPGWATGITVREGDVALYATTVYVPPAALTDYEAVVVGHRRVKRRALEVYEQYGPMHVAIEMLRPSVVHTTIVDLVMHGRINQISRELTRLKSKGLVMTDLESWVGPLALAYALAQVFDGAVEVAAGAGGGLGYKHKRSGEPIERFYPPSLYGRRSESAGSAHFGPNEDPEGKRRDEQAAFDAAGEAHRHAA